MQIALFEMKKIDQGPTKKSHNSKYLRNLFNADYEIPSHNEAEDFLSLFQFFAISRDSLKFRLHFMWNKKYLRNR